jgi:hypothetical protein
LIVDVADHTLLASCGLPGVVCIRRGRECECRDIRGGVSSAFRNTMSASTKTQAGIYVPPFIRTDTWSIGTEDAKSMMNDPLM